MASNSNLIQFKGRKELASYLADVVTAEIHKAIDERKVASLALSGGSTPAALYKDLSTRKVDWSKVTAIPVDERWVAPFEDGSNEKFIRETLQQNNAMGINLVGLWSNVKTPIDGLAVAEERIFSINRPFDVVILGMGNDGHTASWFPHSKGLNVAVKSDAPLAAITANQSVVTGPHTKRMTLTVSAISNANLICLLINGEDKLETYKKALAGNDIIDMPVRAILNARADISVFWAP